MKAILATKEGMTQVFDEQGRVWPCTVLVAAPSVVVQLRTKERDGYQALQVGSGVRKERRTNAALRGHSAAAVKAAGHTGTFRHLREFRVSDLGERAVGEQLTVDSFSEGDRVRVSGITKGKGFQGVVKRHGFHGGPRSHGQKHSEREPGSIGVGGVQRVRKGMRMAGRMGGIRKTVRNVRVLKVDGAAQRLYVFGAVPGRRGTLLEVRGME